MAVKIFFCYAHEDEPLLNKLKSHLSPLRRQGLIEMWHDRDICAGTKWEEEINTHMNEANMILLLISPDFMDSDYCYGKEMQRALERHQRGEAQVIPVILRPTLWQGAPFGKLQALPKDAKPVTDPDWQILDRALFNVTEGIRKVVKELTEMSSISLSSLTDLNKLKPDVEEPIQSSVQRGYDRFLPPSEQGSEASTRVSQTLKDLADQIATCDWGAANLLRSLSQAVKGDSTENTWIASDIFKDIDPDLIVERFKKQQIRAGQNRDIPLNLLFWIRNILCFPPLIFTWYAVSVAVNSYQSNTAKELHGSPPPFLIAWFQGLGGTLPLLATFGSVVFFDLLALVLVWILTMTISRRSKIISIKGELSAEKLREDIIGALEEAFLYLPSKQK